MSDTELVREPASPTQNGSDDAQKSTATARLRQEANEMRRRPPTISPGRNVYDITEKFTSATKQLPAGQLVKDEFFTLFEAVGALEIMDPKMDSGYVPDGDTFEAEFDPCVDLTPAEVTWIMDELFRLEMLFHDGYPLSQNIFTSLHVDRLIGPDNRSPYYFEKSLKTGTANSGLIHNVLRAYCLGLIKCCELTIGLIQRQTYYEEEDFVTSLFGRELCPMLTLDVAVQSLVDALGWVDKCNLGQEIKNALEQRLLIRECLIYCMDEPVESDIQDWQKLRWAIANLDIRDHSSDNAVRAAFSDKVQRQLATSTPPRPMPDLSWSTALERWTQLCDDILAARQLTASHVRLSSQSLQRAVLSFASRSPVPNTFARAKMQEVLTVDQSVAGQVSHFDLLLNDINEVVLGGDTITDVTNFHIELPSDWRHRSARILEDFMQKVMQEYLNFYRMPCQNRCRMRRTMSQAIGIWDELETLGIDFDRQLVSVVPQRRREEISIFGPFSHWTKFYKSRTMQWTILLGFETDIYLPSELSIMYSLLDVILDQGIKERLFVQKQTKARIASLEKSRDLKASQYRLYQALDSEGWLTSTMATYQAMQRMSSALRDLYHFLEAVGAINARPSRYSNDQLYYEARMKPFLGMNNTTIPPEEQIMRKPRWETTPVNKAADQLCKTCTESLKAAQSTLAELKTMDASQVKCFGTVDDWQQDIKAMEKVCIAIRVTVTQLQNIYKDDETLVGGLERGEGATIEATISEPGKRYHDWWVVPKVVVKSR